MFLRWLRLVFLLIGVCLVTNPGAAQTGPAQLLLVCGAESAIPALTHAEVRKLFLGAHVEKNGVHLIPLRNASDSRGTEVFLQKIIFMSERKYERQLASRVFRLGGVRPKVFESFPELVGSLRLTPGSVTYMWSTQLEQAPGLKTLGILWEGSEQ